MSNWTFCTLEKTRVVIKFGPLSRYLPVPISASVHVTSEGSGETE